MKQTQKALLIGIGVLLVVLPLFVYIARQRQELFKQAAFGELTVNFVPEQVIATAGEPFTVEVHGNSADKPVSAATVRINNPPGLVVQSIQGATSASESFTDFLYDQGRDPLTFTVLSKKPTSALPSGSFKIATITFIAFQQGTSTVSVDTSGSEAVGYNGTSEDVALTVVQGIQTAYTATGNLCRTTQCVPPEGITMTPETYTDNAYSIVLSFPRGSEQTRVFKIYRAVGSAVPPTHPDGNIAGVVAAGTASPIQFVDTNGGSGFEPDTVVHYDIDSYFICPSS